MSRRTDAMDMDKVPFRKKSDLARETLRLLHEYAERRGGQKVVPPIPIEEIIEFHLKLDFRVDDLQKILGMSDVLGATWIDEERIIIDERVTHEGRYTFTCAHEVGHWQLHRHLFEFEKRQPSLFGPTENKPGIVCRKREKKKRGEWQADYFASCLLMPEAFVHDAFQKAFPDQRQIVIGEDDGEKIFGREMESTETAWWLAKKVNEAGDFSNVSNEALKYRLNDLKLFAYPKSKNDDQTQLI